MKLIIGNGLIKCIVFLFLQATVLGSCTKISKGNKRDARTYFTIDSLDRKIVLPVLFNDSIVSNLAFDSGASLGAFIVDSTFCSAHSSILSNLSPDTIAPYGCAWSVLRMPASMYTIVPTIKVGNSNLIYDKMLVYNWRDYMGGTQSDGLFNIPQNDTVNIWEFNFEHNYMVIHSFQDFIMPKNCILIPFVRGNDKSSLFYVNLPLNIRCADGDTLMLAHTYLVDTGMPQDIALMAQASELSFFSKKKNAVWTQAPSGYYSHHNVNVTLFSGIQLDSLRIYIFDQPNQVPCDYLIGLNFLKRFNVFFDMKSQRLGLQPIKNYERVVNPRKKRFHMSSRMNSHGKIIITKIADYEGNYVKKSGLLEGDEIIAINEIPIKMISLEEDAELSRQDTLIYDIVRQGKSYKIPVVIDKKEVQGD